MVFNVLNVLKVWMVFNKSTNVLKVWMVFNKTF